jgi:hypothetical protein
VVHIVPTGLQKVKYRDNINAIYLNRYGNVSLHQYLIVSLLLCAHENQNLGIIFAIIAIGLLGFVV